MKKGCFFSAIIFGTILIGVIFYIVDKHGDKIVDYFENRVVELTTESVEDYVVKLTHQEQKDSLKAMWNKVYEKSQAMEFEDGISYLSTVITKIDRYTRDSLLTSNEYKSLKEFIENETE